MRRRHRHAQRRLRQHRRLKPQTRAPGSSRGRCPSIRMSRWSLRVGRRRSHARVRVGNPWRMWSRAMAKTRSMLGSAPTRFPSGLWRARPSSCVEARSPRGTRVWCSTRGSGCGARPRAMRVPSCRAQSRSKGRAWAHPTGAGHGPACVPRGGRCGRSPGRNPGRRFGVLSAIPHVARWAQLGLHRGSEDARLRLSRSRSPARCVHSMRSCARRLVPSI
jgi:hypothetical protein